MRAALIDVTYCKSEHMEIGKFILSFRRFTEDRKSHSFSLSLSLEEREGSRGAACLVGNTRQDGAFPGARIYSRASYVIDPRRDASTTADGG